LVRSATFWRWGVPTLVGLGTALVMTVHLGRRSYLVDEAYNMLFLRLVSETVVGDVRVQRWQPSVR